MQGRGSFALTEASIASAMDNEEGRKWAPLRRLHPNSTSRCAQWTIWDHAGLSTSMNWCVRPNSAATAAPSAGAP